MDLVKFFEATAWPAAVIVVAIIMLMIIRMIITKSGKIGVKLKDWVEFEASASEQIGSSISEEKPQRLEQNGDLTSLATDGKPEHDVVSTAVNETSKIDVNTTKSKVIDIIILSSNIDELQAGFEMIKNDDSNEIDKEFWWTFCVESKSRFGVSGVVDELKMLAEDNPGWVRPTMALLRKAVDSHDADEATALISKLLSRRNKDNAAEVLKSVVYAYYNLFSAERAIKFYQAAVRDGANSSERSAMLAGLAANFDNSTQKFAYRTAAEMALLIDSGSDAGKFNLAYSYSEDTRTWALAFDRYCYTDQKSEYYNLSLNNRGVLLSDIDKESSIDYYSRAMNEKSALGASNLARHLIDDGYFSVGEKILNDIADVQDAAEHISASRTAALAGRRAMSKRLDAILAFTGDESKRYHAILARAMRSVDRENPKPRGTFASDDHSFRVLFDHVGAACQFHIGTIRYEGVLVSMDLGYNGTLTVKSASALNSAIFVSLFITSSRDVSAIIWPSSQSTDDRMRITELCIVEDSLAKVLEQTPSNMLIEN